MLLFWKIRYFDRKDKQFKDRLLCLDTRTLDAVTRAAVELAAENQFTSSGREMLKYKHFFLPDESESGSNVPPGWDKFSTFCVPDYFEDETGKEISQRELGPLLTGKPDAILVPSGLGQH